MIHPLYELKYHQTYADDKHLTAIKGKIIKVDDNSIDYIQIDSNFVSSLEKLSLCFNGLCMRIFIKNEIHPKEIDDDGNLIIRPIFPVIFRHLRYCDIEVLAFFNNNWRNGLDLITELCLDINEYIWTFLNLDDLNIIFYKSDKYQEYDVSNTWEMINQSKEYRYYAYLFYYIETRFINESNTISIRREGIKRIYIYDFGFTIKISGFKRYQSSRMGMGLDNQIIDKINGYYVIIPPRLSNTTKEICTYVNIDITFYGNVPNVIDVIFEKYNCIRIGVEGLFFPYSWNEVEMRI